MSQEQSQKPPSAWPLVVACLAFSLGIAVLLSVATKAVHGVGYAVGSVKKAATEGYSAGSR